MSRPENAEAVNARPVGSLADGTDYYAPIGELIYDGDGRVLCHLCGRLMRIIGGTHVRVTHGWTFREYREAFHLPERAATCSRELSARLRDSAICRLVVDERFGRPPRSRDAQLRTPRWRSLAERRPELVGELSPRNENFDPTRVGAGSGQKAVVALRRVRARMAGSGRQPNVARQRLPGVRDQAPRAVSRASRRRAIARDPAAGPRRRARPRSATAILIRWRSERPRAGLSGGSAARARIAGRHRCRTGRGNRLPGVLGAASRRDVQCRAG